GTDARTGRARPAGTQRLPEPAGRHGSSAPARRTPVTVRNGHVNYIDELAQAIRARVDPGYELPRTDTQRLFRMYAVLALVKGTGVTAKDVHDAWAAWECDRKPHAPSIVPFVQLPPETQRLDEPFVAAILAA